MPPVKQEELELEETPKDSEPTEPEAVDASPQSFVRALPPQPKLSKKDLQARIAQLEEELDAQRDRTLRAMAEAQNVRRRSREEIRRAGQERAAELIAAVLPVVDNLQRALEAAQAHTASGMEEGVRLILRQLIGILEQQGVTVQQPLGQPFDASRYEAVGKQVSIEHPEDTVLEVVRPGYEMGDMVLRPSQVVVSLASAPEEGVDAAPQNP